MGTALAFEFESQFRPVSPFVEIGAYESLWSEAKTSFKSIAELFRKSPGSLPSDFVDEEKSLRTAMHVKDILHSAGIDDFGIRVHGAGEYPEKLRVADHPVELLYYRGWWDLVNTRGVAVVGTREPSAEGIARTRKLTKQLVRDGITVVSGLAKGVDRVVHETALAEGGRTIAVLGAPLNVRYPKENADLQERLSAEQLVISQVPVLRYSNVSNPTVNRFFFVERNITMSALTEATIIVEAGETSGTLVQARHALKQNRKLFILESNFRNPTLSWPAKFEELGAIRVRDYEDIRVHLGLPSVEN